MFNMTPEYKMKLYRGLKIALVVFVAVVLANAFVGPERYNRSGDQQDNVIVVTGHGEVSAVPDIASIYLTIRKEAKTVKEAQASVAEIEQKVLDLLKNNNILEKDIKTDNASFNPKYEYQYRSAVCLNCPPSGKSVIVGYEAYENLTVKIRNTDDAGKIIEGLGTLGVTELSGPNFTIDNEDDLKIEARRLAINEAKVKARILAKDLGIRLGKITSFNEGNNYPMPIYEKMMTGTNDMASSAQAELPKGENTISSDVTITYTIR